jgi:hypothetical protein
VITQSGLRISRTNTANEEGSGLFMIVDMMIVVLACL